MRKIKSMFCGLFWGAVIGGALVVLFTPYSGDELKHRVTDYVENVKDEVKRAGEEKRAELEKQLASYRSGV
jgi:gas vesicle protein